MKNLEKTLIVSICAMASLLGLYVPAVAAASEPVWKIDNLADTTAVPGEEFAYLFELYNVGDAASTPGETFSVHLPHGFTAEDLTFNTGNLAGKHLEEPLIGSPLGSCTGNGPEGKLPGSTEFSCTLFEGIRAHSTSGVDFSAIRYILRLEVGVAAGAARSSTATFQVEGGGAAAAASAIDNTRVAPTASGFGIDGFDVGFAADGAGTPSTEAARHPYSTTTSVDFNTVTNPLPLRGDAWTAEPPRDAVVDLPPGLVGSTAGIDRCTTGELAERVFAGIPEVLCPNTSQIGTALIRTNSGNFPYAIGPVPVFNMVPPPNAPAQFGLNVLGTVVTLTAHVRSSGNYSISVSGREIPEGLAVAGSTFTFWNLPADPAHTPERACPGQLAPWQEEAPSCSSTAPLRPFLRNPTACSPRPSEGIATSVHVDSWFRPATFDQNGEPELSDPRWVSADSRSHELPGYPFPTEPSTFPEGYSGPTERGPEVGIAGCSQVPFEPELNVEPTTQRADAPSGLKVDLKVPQDCWEAKATVQEVEEAICQSDLRDAEVVLPEGMSVNPSSAAGLDACTAEQIGLATPVGQVSPIHFVEQPATCPDASKIGTVEIETPLLEEHLKGSVYLAQQGQNPFGSLLAIYLVAEGAGVVVKQAGQIKVDPTTGRLATEFTEAPQTPFSDLHLELFGGARAALRTPAACGTYTATSQLTPWSHAGTEGEQGTPIAEPSSSFQITPCQGGGFNPKLSAGTANPRAGAFSPFNLQLTREDDSQELGGLTAKLPEGLLAKLAGIAYCPDSALASLPREANGEALLGSGRDQITSPACPAASQVGAVTVGAGAGPDPFYTDKGRAYLAGPYKGAPLSLAVVAPAVAGPFDLGSVVVRNALRVDPETTRATAVSDPFPTILHGIPLDLRDVRVELNRNEFTLNPTSCEPMAVDSTVTSVTGTTANPSVRFQVGGCEALAFKPKLALRFTGKTKRTGNPALHATLKMPQGGANISYARVTLPKGELIDNAHINNPCTRVQFAAGQCPPKSILGYARAVSPLLDKPLEGPVYFRSNGGDRKLPDLVADLDGQIHVDLVGFIDAKKARIRNTFALVPDAPVSKFTLSLFGGKRGLIENGHNLCRRAPVALAQFDGQNGKVADSEVPIKVRCGAKGKKHKRHRHRRN